MNDVNVKVQGSPIERICFIAHFPQPEQVLCFELHKHLLVQISLINEPLSEPLPLCLPTSVNIPVLGLIKHNWMVV